MRIRVEDIDIIDEPREKEASIVQCFVEIGHSESFGVDLFTVDVCNRRWAEKNLGFQKTGFHQKVLILDEIVPEAIKQAIQAEFAHKDYDNFEAFVLDAQDWLVWGFS